MRFTTDERVGQRKSLLVKCWPWDHSDSVLYTEQNVLYSVRYFKLFININLKNVRVWTKTFWHILFSSLTYKDIFWRIATDMSRIETSAKRVRHNFTCRLLCVSEGNT